MAAPDKAEPAPSKTGEAVGSDGSIADCIEGLATLSTDEVIERMARKQAYSMANMDDPNGVDSKAMWQHGGTPVYSPEMAAAAWANTPRSSGGATALQVMNATSDYKAAVARAEIKVREVMEKRATKQRPNEACQCGSGKKYKKCCGVALDPKKLNPHGMTVQGEARSADGTIRKDAITVRMEATGELVQMPLSQLARSESHAQAVKDADAARQRGEPNPQPQLPAVRTTAGTNRVGV